MLGGDDADTITMTGGNVTGSVSGQSGDDRITLTGGSVHDDVIGGDGADQISVAAGFSIGDDLLADSGLDTVVFAGELAGDLDGGADGDSLFMLGGSIGGSVLGGDGSDTITMTAGFVGGSVLGQSGGDFITVTGGSVQDDVGGGDGADQISILGGTLLDIFGGSVADIIVVNGAAVDLQGGTIGGDEGDDSLSLLSAATLSGADIFGGSGNDAVEVATGVSGLLSSVDSLFGGSGSGDLAVFSGYDGLLSEEFGGFETVHLLAGATLDVHNPGAATPDDRDLSSGAVGPISVFIDATSGLIANGNSPGTLTINGNVGNEGFISMRDDDADDLVTITGDYAGDGTGRLEIDAALDASEQADLLVIGGGVTDVNVPQLVAEGTTTLIVNDIGNGIGTQSVGNGIAVIDVSATGNTDADDFLLQGGPIRVGAAEYGLVLESDGIWYLQGEFLDQVFGYAAAPSAMLGMARDYMGDLKERVGAREQTWSGGATQISDGSGVWLRSGGFFGKVDGDTDFQELDYDQNHYFAQIGADISLLSDDSTGHLIASIMGHAGYSETHHDDAGNNEIAKDNIHAYGGGLALTWYGGQGEGWIGEGLYVDGVAQVTFYELETKTTAEGMRGETDGWGWSIGLEAGYAFNIGGERDGPRLVPQIQIVYSQISLDDFTDEDDIDVEFDNGDSLEGRLGLAVDSGKMWRSINAYAEANVVHEFLGDTEVHVSQAPVDYDLGGTAAELGLGGTVSLLDNVNLYADIDYRIPFDNGRKGASVIGGLRISF